MEYTTVDRIDEQMARLEERLQHTSVPLAEEKRVLEDIKKLRQSRVCIVDNVAPTRGKAESLRRCQKVHLTIAAESCRLVAAQHTRFNAYRRTSSLVSMCRPVWRSTTRS